MGIERFYTSGHTIQRVTVTQGDYGGIKETWADHLKSIRGKLWQLRGDERQIAGKVTYFADARFATAIANITELDRYVDPDSVAYHIRAVATRKRPDGSGHMELDLELIR